MARLEGDREGDDKGVDEDQEADEQPNIHSEVTSGLLEPNGGGGELPTVHEVRFFITDFVANNDPSSVNIETFNRTIVEKWPHFSAKAWDRLHLMLPREICDPGWALRSAPTRGQVHEFVGKYTKERSSEELTEADTRRAIAQKFLDQLGEASVRKLVRLIDQMARAEIQRKN